VRMNRLLITLRDVSWLSVLAVVLIVVAISTAVFISSLTGLAVVLGLSSITLAVLSQKE
jgi:hypothetical protein